MQRLEVSGAVRHIYIYVVRRQRVKQHALKAYGWSKGIAPRVLNLVTKGAFLSVSRPGTHCTGDWVGRKLGMNGVVRNRTTILRSSLSYSDQQTDWATQFPNTSLNSSTKCPNNRLSHPVSQHIAPLFHKCPNNRLGHTVPPTHRSTLPQNAPWWWANWCSKQAEAVNRNKPKPNSPVTPIYCTTTHGQQNITFLTNSLPKSAQQFKMYIALDWHLSACRGTIHCSVAAFGWKCRIRPLTPHATIIGFCSEIWTLVPPT
jgi:hypothetical protein